MALKPTIYKAQVELADSDRNHYEQLSLTLARHPSETQERLFSRLLAFCLHADRGLEFTRGLSSTDEPDLWQHADSGELLHWFELGQPTPERLRKASGRSRAVTVYTYGESAATWWKQNGADIDKLAKVSVWQLPWPEVQAGAPLLVRNAQLSISVVGGVIYLDDGDTSLTIEPVRLKDSG